VVPAAFFDRLLRPAQGNRGRSTPRGRRHLHLRRARTHHGRY
jgi:hypothetical protein